MERNSIFKELKRRFNYLQKDLNYEVVFVALQGSQNYGLDLYTDYYTSDIDCMAVVLPTLEDIINNKQPVSTTIVLDNNEHINIKDIRLMFDLFKKQNPQFLEVLFTEYKIVNKEYKEVVKSLFANAEKIANINRVVMYNCIAGSVLQKLTDLKRTRPSVTERYEYDGKQLHHMIRLYQFICNLEAGKSFKEALTFFDDSEDTFKLCMDAKLNNFTLKFAEDTAHKYSSLVNDIKDNYKLTHSNQDNLEYIDILDTIKANVLKQYFTKQLTPEIPEEYKLCPDQYHRVFVTSDTHFFHSNILKYETKRWNMMGMTEHQAMVNYLKMIGKTEEEIIKLIDTSWEEYRSEACNYYTKLHNEKLIENWNKVVSKTDLVIILGDFSFGKARETEELLNRLNGDKVLIRGNHDIFLEDKKFNKKLFKAVYDYKETKYMGQEIALMHYPIQKFKHMDKETKPAVLLFGHIHSVYTEIPKHSFNVGVDVNNYTPVNIETAIQHALFNEGGLYNT